MEKEQIINRLFNTLTSNIAFLFRTKVHKIKIETNIEFLLMNFNDSQYIIKINERKESASYDEVDIIVLCTGKEDKNTQIKDQLYIKTGGSVATELKNRIHRIRKGTTPECILVNLDGTYYEFIIYNLL